jgi:hypothetical protein
MYERLFLDSPKRLTFPTSVARELSRKKEVHQYPAPG